MIDPATAKVIGYAGRVVAVVLLLVFCGWYIKLMSNLDEKKD